MQAVGGEGRLRPSKRGGARRGRSGSNTKDALAATLGCVRWAPGACGSEAEVVRRDMLAKRS